MGINKDTLYETVNFLQSSRYRGLHLVRPPTTCVFSQLLITSKEITHKYLGFFCFLLMAKLF